MPARCQPQAVGMRKDAAFADQQPVVGHQFRQPLGGFEADLEGPQVAVVDADQSRREFQRPLGLGLVMHLDQRIHAELECRVLQRLRRHRRRRSP